jgi:hypothetical protein
MRRPRWQEWGALFYILLYPDVLDPRPETLAYEKQVLERWKRDNGIQYDKEKV